LVDALEARQGKALGQAYVAALIGISAVGLGCCCWKESGEIASQKPFIPFPPPLYQQTDRSATRQFGRVFYYYYYYYYYYYCCSLNCVLCQGGRFMGRGADSRPCDM
jgi:hypothetical protein